MATTAAPSGRTLPAKFQPAFATIRPKALRSLAGGGPTAGAVCGWGPTVMSHALRPVGSQRLSSVPGSSRPILLAMGQFGARTARMLEPHALRQCRDAMKGTRPFPGGFFAECSSVGRAILVSTLGRKFPTGENRGLAPRQRTRPIAGRLETPAQNKVPSRWRRWLRLPRRAEFRPVLQIFGPPRGRNLPSGGAKALVVLDRRLAPSSDDGHGRADRSEHFQ